MKKSENKPILFFAGISIFLCGCPGTALFLAGAAHLIETFSRIEKFGDFFATFAINDVHGVWMVCLSVLLLLVPLGLVVLLLVNRGKETPLKSLEPTGASQDDPIPPTH